MPGLEENPFVSNDALGMAKALDPVMGGVYGDRFELLSTMRYDAPPANRKRIAVKDFFLLRLHWLRLQAALAFFSWTVELEWEPFFEQLVKAVKDLERSKSYKLRVLLHKDGRMDVESYPVPRKDNLYEFLQCNVKPPLKDQFRVIIDKTHTVGGPFTAFKTTKREHHNQVRERSLLPEMQQADGRPQEVLLFTPQGHISEGSITNIAVWSNGVWITPYITTGCLCGVMRHHLLSEGKIIEGTIFAQDMIEGQPILLFNAVQGVCYGVLHIPEDRTDYKVILDDADDDEEEFDEYDNEESPDISEHGDKTPGTVEHDHYQGESMSTPELDVPDTPQGP